MEEILRKVLKSEEYKSLSSYLGRSGALRSELIGNVSELCKESKANSFDEWFLNYLENEKSGGLVSAARRLQRYTQEQGKYYSYKSCYDCVITFVLLVTWIGTKMEQKAKDKLKNCRYKVDFTNHEEDILYGADLYISRNGKRLWGIQIKPISYYYIKRNNPNDYRVLKNNEKNAKYKEKYGYKVIYLYYNDDEEFDDECIEAIKKCILKEVERLCKVS